ncbi:MAG: hypothetical protein MdMp014T_0829 [Treponematales bacterium]|jgi:hypothetical protein
MPDKPTSNTGRLCSIFCPVCGKVTDKISFNLLREAGNVKVACPVCQEDTFLKYDGKTVSVYHHDDAFERIWTSMTKEEKADFKKFLGIKQKNQP